MEKPVPLKNHFDQMDSSWERYPENPSAPTFTEVLVSKPRTPPCRWGEWGKEDFIRFEAGDCLVWTSQDKIWKIEKYRKALKLRRKKG